MCGAAGESRRRAPSGNGNETMTRNHSETTLVVGDAARAADPVGAAGPSCRAVASTTGVLRLLRSEPAMRAVLLSPSKDLDAHLELCRNIKFDRNTAMIAVLFIVGEDQLDRIADAFDAGA